MNKDAFIFHIPHASVRIPKRYLPDFEEGVLPDNLRHMTDWYTDRLFDFPFGGRVVFPVSRLLCDPERFREDENEEMAEIGMGAVYTQGYDLKPLRKEGALSRREKILKEFYDPHHRRLESAVVKALTAHGECLIVDCHSFSAVPLPYEKDTLRPDICIGTDPFHTPDGIAKTMERFFTSEGLSVSLNRPFSGTMVPLTCYRKDAQVRSVMIEVNRGLYMKGEGDQEKVRDLIREVLFSVMQR